MQVSYIVGLTHKKQTNIRHAHTYPLCGLWRAKEYGYERQPDDAGGVHSKSDGFGLIEGFGHASGLDGVHCARHHQQDGVTKGADEGQVRDVALEDAACRHGILGPLFTVVHHRVGRVHRKPDKNPQQLDGNQWEGDDELGGRRDEPGEQMITDEEVVQQRSNGARIWSWVFCICLKSLYSRKVVQILAIFMYYRFFK